MNLIDGGIQHSRMFLHMPLFDEISYQGSFENKVKKFRAVHEDQPCQILALDVIRKDEEVIWDAFLDLIKRSVAQAAAAVRGVYTFELLTMEIQKVPSRRETAGEIFLCLRDPAEFERRRLGEDHGQERGGCF